MTRKKSYDIKPCRFCGSIPRVFFLKKDIYISCPKCKGFSVSARNIALGVDLWNNGKY